jgi:hypothetical protein
MTYVPAKRKFTKEKTEVLRQIQKDASDALRILLLPHNEKGGEEGNPYYKIGYTKRTLERILEYIEGEEDALFFNRRNHRVWQRKRNKELKQEKIKKGE